MEGIDTQLVLPLVIIAAGALNSVIMGLLKKASTAISTLNPFAKQAILVVTAFGVTKLATFIGLPLPGDVTTWSGDLVNSVVVSLISLGVHNVKKTVVTETAPESAK